MSSLFESRVRERRHHTPWTELNVDEMLADLTLNNPSQAPATLTCEYRHSVSTRFWWTLDWTGADGQAYRADAQTLQVCLWRAAEREVSIRARLHMLSQIKEASEPMEGEVRG